MLYPLILQKTLVGEYHYLHRLRPSEMKLFAQRPIDCQ